MNGTLFQTGYEVLDQWQAMQAPADRVSIDGELLTVELRAGDTSQWGHRAEVYDRHAIPGSTPAARWPDPPGATRRYEISVLFPEAFEISLNPDKWFTFAQLKGYGSMGPPLAFEVKRDRLRLGGRKAAVDLGLVKRGVMTNLALTVTLSPDPALGRVHVERDGTVMVDRMQATIDGTPAAPVPVYWKQGIYRSEAWTVTHSLWFGPTRISEVSFDAGEA